ncbi:MerR family transcriptional regulator [Limosilactobacillus fastidiosus]|nr:MerR family transcriptional regulator [Limosilactobacillus fastidiosus]MCD7084637.1 MerR family transcriptional regulator [Limosilactobacillus fastidiosus]
MMMSILLADRFHKMIGQNNLRVTMSQLVEMTGVSSSQIRYWEKKGYIESEQEEKNQNHLFPVTMLFRVCTIKFFLDQGYTLAVAVKKEQERRESVKLLRKFILNQKLNVKQLGPGKGEIEIGEIAEDPHIEVYATVKNGKTELHLRQK